MRTRLIAIAIALVPGVAARPGAQPSPPPIIDMHLHAERADMQGPPPMGMCPGTVFPVPVVGRPWPDTFMEHFKKPPCAQPIWSPASDAELMNRTMAVMKRRNVYGVASGVLTEQWQKAAPDRIIPAFGFELGAERTPSIAEVRDALASGRYRVFGEVANQYQGLEPGDPAFEPYLAIVEELGIPMSIHLGTGPPGSPYLGYAKYRARLHSALTIVNLSENEIARHHGRN